MAHELDFNKETGEARMFYAGKEKPWHGCGIQLDTPATAEEAITFAQLNWLVTKEPIFTKDGLEVPERFATVREVVEKGKKKREPLSVVGSNYTILQNHECFTFFDPVVDRDEAVYETAGSLRGGKQVWLLAKLGDVIKVVGDDIIERYVALTNSHDGTSSVQATLTGTRVVCANTLAMAFGSRGHAISIRHTKSMKDRLGEAARVMGIVTKQTKESTDAFKKMVKDRWTEAELDAYFNALYPDNEEAKSNTRTENIRISLARLHDRECTIAPKSAGTAWSAYNSVTAFTSHEMTMQKNNNRFNSVTFGSGAWVNRQALKLALAN